MIRAAEARVPHVFVAPLRERAARRLAWGGLIGLTLYCLILFDFSPVRLWNGLSGLGLIAGLMVPPRTNGLFLEFAYAILETLSLALIGTLIATAIALPLGFRAAGNVVPGGVLRIRQDGGLVGEG